MRDRQYVIWFRHAPGPPDLADLFSTNHATNIVAMAQSDATLDKAAGAGAARSGDILQLGTRFWMVGREDEDFNPLTA